MKEAKETLGLSKDKSEENNSLQEEDKTKRRQQTALHTVTTSMRGILSENDSAPKRKKLLGE